MTTAKKPRSTTASRKTSATRETSSAKTTTAAKPRSKSTKTGASPSAAASAPVNEPVLMGSAAGETAVNEPEPATRAASASLQGGAPSPDTLHRRIAEAAYFRAERRGFAPGGEEMDWFAAEAEVRRLQRRV